MAVEPVAGPMVHTIFVRLPKKLDRFISLPHSARVLPGHISSQQTFLLLAKEPFHLLEGKESSTEHFRISAQLGRSKAHGLESFFICSLSSRLKGWLKQHIPEASVSQQPLFPQLQIGPSSSMVICPTSPAAPMAPE
jgi:hypothetical protein